MSSSFGTSENQQKRVFISYAREDYVAADRLHEDLKRAGLRPWLDKKDLIGGQDWKLEIKKAVRMSRCFIALFSLVSVQKRGYVQREYKLALDVLDEFAEGEIFAIPVRLDNCEIPYEKFRALEYVDLFPDWNQGVERLLRSFGSTSKNPLSKLKAPSEYVTQTARRISVDAHGSITKDSRARTKIKQLPGPKLVYRGGPLMNSVKVFTIFWGSAWNKQYAGLATKLNDFLKYIVTSEFIDQLSEYSIPDKYLDIGRGKYTGTITITRPNPKSTITDPEIRRLLLETIYLNDNVSLPSSDTIYFIYIAPGVDILSSWGERSDKVWCGYHTNIRKQIFYSVIAYPGDNCSAGMSIIDALTTITSHQLSELVTDAIQGQGWYNERYGEIGDICSWQTKRIGRIYTVQKQWSNKQNSCI